MSLSSPDGDDTASETLDELYENLAEVQAHLSKHDEEREQLKREVDEMSAKLSEQRDTAAKAGERATYEKLSGELADLHRSWMLLQEDYGADPLEEYQPDGTDQDQPGGTEPDPDASEASDQPPDAPEAPTPNEEPEP